MSVRQCITHHRKTVYVYKSAQIASIIFLSRIFLSKSPVSTRRHRQFWSDGTAHPDRRYHRFSSDYGQLLCDWPGVSNRTSHLQAMRWRVPFRSRLAWCLISWDSLLAWAFFGRTTEVECRKLDGQAGGILTEERLSARVKGAMASETAIRPVR